MKRVEIGLGCKEVKNVSENIIYEYVHHRAFMKNRPRRAPENAAICHFHLFTEERKTTMNIRVQIL